MKLLHIADIHFGVKFLNKNIKLRKKLIDSQFIAFEKVINYLIENNIDALLIAGDLFDSSYRSLKVERFLLSEFNKLNKHKINVFYSLGNHDSNETFNDNFLFELPENVIIFKKDNYESYLLNNELYIHSCGHQKNYENRNLVMNFPNYIDGYMNVGLLHCSILSSIKKEDKYLPTTIKELSDKKYDYWALGHIHKREKINEEIYYSGSLQGLNSKETGLKGGLLIDLNTDYKVVKFIEFGVIDYIDIEIDFSKININNKNNLISYIEKNIKINKESIIKLYFLDETIIFDYLNNQNNQDEIKEILLKNELILDIQIDVSKIKRKIDYKEYIRNNNILGYIEKNYNNKEIVKRIMNENKIKEIDDNILEKIFDKMVSDKDEI
jgi:DNA repair exonuclease SbcCD nuclease subunit